MRVWGWLLALVSAAGCGVQPTMYADISRPPAPRLNPHVMAKRLIAMQPDWPHPVKARTDCRRIKCVALTFDDGPGEYTGRLLDILAAHRVKATFFVVGQMVAEDHRSVRRIADLGHELGNHSWSHEQLTRLSTGGIKYQLKHTQDLVERITGLRMRVMRPPYGSTDDRVTTETRHEGLAQILWNVDTLDWRDRVASIVAKRAAKARPGSIVLMHDIHKTTVDAVPGLLKSLEKKGYTFVTVSDLYGKPPAPGRKYTER